MLVALVRIQELLLVQLNLLGQIVLVVLHQPAQNDVWYKFQAISSELYIALAPKSGLGGVLELRLGCSGSLLMCSDDGGGEGGFEDF
jgi:hypothetical protein